MSEIEIKLSHTLLSTIQAYLENANSSPDDFLLPGHRGRRWNRKSFRRALRRHLKHCGIEFDGNPSWSRLSGEQVDLLLNTPVESYVRRNYMAEERDRVAFSLLSYTGMRRAELIALDTDDIDFEYDIIHIRQGKGNKPRDIPLPPQVRTDLQAYMRKYVPEPGPLFRGNSGHSRWNPRKLYSAFRRHVTHCGLGKDVTPHILRHTCATRLFWAGIDPRTVQELLGHERLESTMIYVHTTMERMRDAITALSR